MASRLERFRKMTAYTTIPLRNMQRRRFILLNVTRYSTWHLVRRRILQRTWDGS